MQPGLHLQLEVAGSSPAHATARLGGSSVAEHESIVLVIFADSSNLSRDTTMLKFNDSEPICLPCEMGQHGCCEGQWLVARDGRVHSTCACPPCLVFDLTTRNDSAA
jgi:hypothetical protein